MVYCGTRNTFSFKNSVNKGKGVGPRGAEPPRIKFCWVPTNSQPNMSQNVGSKEDLITKNIPNRTKHSTIHRQQQQQVRLLLHVISQIILSNGVQQWKVIFTKTILVWQLQGGGHSRQTWVEVCRRRLQILTLFKTKSRSFLYPD